MNTIATTLHTLSETLVPTLASLAVWATILLVAAWLATTGLRRRPAAVRCCIWQFTFVGLAALPLIYSLVPGPPRVFAADSIGHAGGCSRHSSGSDCPRRTPAARRNRSGRVGKGSREGEFPT